MDRRLELPGGLNLPAWETLPDIGLYMDQVMTLMERAFAYVPGVGEMTKSMVNNYVKAGLIPRPRNKKYDRDQLAQLMMIAVLKQALTMEEIAKVLGLLCADGAQAGYARFCDALCGEERQGDAVSASIAAARMVIHARGLLARKEGG